MVCLSPGSASTVEDLIHFFFNPVQYVVVEEVISVVNIKGQIHFPGWEGPVKEYGRVAFKREESIVVSLLHDGLAGGDRANQDQAYQFTIGGHEYFLLVVGICDNS